MGTCAWSFSTVEPATGADVAIDQVARVAVLGDVTLEQRLSKRRHLLDISARRPIDLRPIVP